MANHKLSEDIKIEELLQVKGLTHVTFVIKIKVLKPYDHTKANKMPPKKVVSKGW